MLVQQQILIAIKNSKLYSQYLLDRITVEVEEGENLIQCQERLILITNWVQVLQRYYDDHFDSNGNITPVQDCLTEIQILELVSKTKVLIGNVKFPAGSDWILANGVWNDLGVWRDDNVWIDSVNWN